MSSLRGRRRYLVGAVLCFAFLVGGVLWLRQPLTVARSLQPYALGPKTLPDLRDPAAPLHFFGGKRARPLVVNFFFSDCVGCVDELPRFEAAAAEWAGRVDIVGVDHFEPRAEGLKLVKSTGITFPVAWDETGELAPLAQVTAFPATLFIDQDGRVVNRVLGQLSSARLNRELKALFSTSHVN